MINHNISYLIKIPSVVVLVFTAPRDAFTATSFNNTLQNTAEADITVGTIYKFPTEVLDQLDSYDPATGYYRPQTKFAKVMFSQVSVCPQRVVSASGPGGCLPHTPGQTPPGRHTHTPARQPQADTPWADTHLWADSPLPSLCWDTHTPA